MPDVSVLRCLGEFAQTHVLPAMSAALTGLEAPFEGSPAGERNADPWGDRSLRPAPCPVCRVWPSHGSEPAGTTPPPPFVLKGLFLECMAVPV